MSRPTTPLAMLALLAACQAPASDASAVSTTPGITTIPGGSPGDSGAGSSGPGAASNSTSSAASTSGELDTGDTTLLLDLGAMPDVGSNPAGCKGKIDLLFVISRDFNMRVIQQQLIDAFPKFIATIQSKFDDFDYHIMVIDGDASWGSSTCNEVCPELGCKVGEPCCPLPTCPNCPQPIVVGDPCCSVVDYPCDYLDEKTACDEAFGAGTVFPAGVHASNKPCPIDAGRRYMIKGQPDLSDTFACAAQVGVSGRGRVGQALTAAMKKNINDPGGCNPGFLRKDALLMVTFISGVDPGGGAPGSVGLAADWAKAVLDAKHGDPESVVMVNIGRKDPACVSFDEVCKLVTSFKYSYIEDNYADDYGPAFETATSLVETACQGFVAPG